MILGAGSIIHKQKRIAMVLALSFLLTELSQVPAFGAQTQSPAAAATAPSGTLLVPMVPKIDTTTPTEPAAPKATEPSDTTGGAEAPEPQEDAAETANNPKLAPAPLTLSPERGAEDEDTSDTKVNENTTLKGTVQL